MNVKKTMTTSEESNNNNEMPQVGGKWKFCGTKIRKERDVAYFFYKTKQKSLAG